MTGDPPMTQAFVQGHQIVTSVPVERSSVQERHARRRLAAWLLGTGTPTVLANRTGPATLVEIGEARVLIDAGNAVSYQLARLGKRSADLTHILITHLHIDHDVDLPFLLLGPWIEAARSQPPVVIGPKGTATYVNRCLAAHDYDIRARVPHGYDPGRLAAPVLEMEDDLDLDMGSWQLRAFRVQHDPVDEAFGYCFNTDQHTLVISGDTTPCDSLIEAATGADVLIHEALYPGFGLPQYHTSVHDVGKIASQAGVRELVLTHLIPGHLPDQQWLEIIERDFAGTVTVGHDLLPVCDFYGAHGTSGKHS